MTWHRACSCCVVPDEEACCFPSGQCSNLTPEECVEFGGIPQGTGTQCSDPDVDCEPAGGCDDCVNVGDCLSSYSVNIEGLAWRFMVGGAGPFYREITPQASVVVSEGIPCVYDGGPFASIPGLSASNAVSCNVTPVMSFDVEWGSTSITCAPPWTLGILFGALGGALSLVFVRNVDASCPNGTYVFLSGSGAGGGAQFLELCDAGTVTVS